MHSADRAARLIVTARRRTCAIVAIVAFVALTGASAQTPDPGRTTRAAPAGSSAITEAILDRAYGYQLGDIVLRRIITRGSASGFDASLLPEPGVINSWLVLRRIAVDREGDERQIRLDYQITAAGPEVSLLFLPAIDLRTADQQLARVDAQPVSVSPIIGARPIQRSGLGDLRADRRDAPAHPFASARLLVVLLAALAAVCTALLWRHRQRLRANGPAPFAHARQELRQLQRAAQTDPGQQTTSAYRVLHRAFDRSAGRSVFLEDVDDVVHSQPAFARARADIERFFRDSRSLFFGAATASASTSPELPGLPDLLELANRLARLERG